MLEDEVERLEKFVPNADWRHWRTAGDFITGFQQAERTPDLICLDHDLFAESSDAADPGDGRDVSGFLATIEPTCHVVIHSSNAPAANSMFFELQDTNWSVERIAPLGSDWIEAYWWTTVKPHLLG